MATNALHEKEVAVEFYDERYRKGYMEEWDETKKNKVREVVRQLDLPATGKALDFGCGNGVFTIILKELLPSWEIYGVEISPMAVKNARERFPGCHFFSADDAAQYKHQFDFLFSHHVIEHVQDLDETLQTINDYLRPSSFQLHIFPCGNTGSFEHHICTLRKHGIEKDKGNRFFFEEPGHLRRLSTADFQQLQEKIGFKLVKEFYSNQYYGAINWITKSSPSFVKKLTDASEAVDDKARKELEDLRKKLLPLTYTQFPYAKYWMIKSKWHKGLADRIKLAILYIPSLFSRPVFRKYENKSREEWRSRKTERNGSEMFLFFAR
jgi:SAM-dependent methyltransferase